MRGTWVVGGVLLAGFGTAAESVRRLPSWVQLGGEIRGRVEPGVYRHRLRFRADVAPVSTLRFALEAADARSRGLSDPADIRIAYAEFGREQGTTMRIGRQELSLGDETLVGADRDWCNFGRAFDAVSVKMRGLRLFSGRVVEPSAFRPNRSSPAAQLSGAFYEGKRWQPFLLWKSPGGDYGRSFATAGTYGSGALPFGAEYQATVAVQPRSWAWAFRGTRRLGGDSGPLVSAWARRASRHFDDLYPAGYNAAGTIDPLAWRNLSTFGAGVTWTILRHVDAIVESHSHAAVSPARYLGVQVNAGAGVRITKNTRAHAGYTHFRGSTVFVMLARRF